jgi:tetratricopeptide (TPR) repeat protein
MTFDPQAWAETCFKRALQVNPRAVLAHTALLNVRRGQRRRGQPLWRVPPASAYERVAALPEAERFEELVDLPRDTYVGFEDLMRYGDDPNVKGRIDLARDQARRYAEDALTLAPKYRAHPRYGLAVYNATMTLGALALRGGDRRKASDFLRQASEASPSEELAYSVDLVSGLHWHLAGNVLELGERAAVIDFLDRMADLNVANRQLLREIASAVRRGDNPVTLSRGRL